MSAEERLIENIKTTMAVEGMFLEESDVNLINRFLKNEITEEEGIDKIKMDILSKVE